MQSWEVMGKATGLENNLSLTKSQEHPPQPILPIKVTREVGRKLEEIQQRTC